MLGMISIAIIPLIFAITVHEVAHGWVASKCGDNTAKILGRLTLNPSKHISLFGTVIMPLLLLFFTGFVFGYAKPVPVTWQNLRRRRVGMALVAAAGPIANLLMALIWAAIAKLSLVVIQHAAPHSSSANIALFAGLMGKYGIRINCIFMILNLIPIPPLDGSRIVYSILPNRWLAVYSRLEPYGMWILILLLMTRALNVILAIPAGMLIFGIMRLAGLG